MKNKNLLLYVILTIFVLAVAVGSFYIDRFVPSPKVISALKYNRPDSVRPGPDKKNYSENDRFRNSIARFVRETANNYFSAQTTECPEELEIESDWQTNITFYFRGEIKGRGSSDKEILNQALEEAVQNLLAGLRGLDEEDVKEGIFQIDFLGPSSQFSVIENKGEGKELIDDLVIIRSLDKELIRQKIEQGKEFLFKMGDPNEHGFHKFYYAPADSLENRLYAVYSASIIYTFLYIADFEEDERISESLSDWGGFLLSMQNKDSEDKRYGAFHYSYYPINKEREKKFVVGTSALSIFTLLRLYDLTGDSEYLESAKLAGDWLATMQNPDGSMKPYVRYHDGKWVSGTQESFLYNGQVLSALSKLYKATADKKYYDAAQRIAKRFAEKYEKERGYIKDEYRKKNPISNAWVVMSLMDFYKNADQSDRYKNIIFELGDKILENQKTEPGGPLSYGQWEGAYSTSGNGWLSEVMVDMYKFCQEQNRGNCGKYKEAVLRAMRWLFQGTYSEENSYLLKNPGRAIGGLFWDKNQKFVRTDSACHALNSYVRIINDLEDGLLLSIPERPLGEVLGQLKSNK